MLERIRGYTDAVIEQVAARQGLPTTASEVASVRDLLGESEQLRRTLVDPGVPLAARRAVVADLLGSKLEADTVRLITFALDADRATEVAADVSWLADRTDAAARRRQPVGEVPLGRTAATERIDGYATAVLEEVATAGGLGDVEDGLFRFMRVVDGSPELRSALTSRELPAPARRAVVTDLLGDRAPLAAVRLAAYSTHVGRPRDYLDHLEWLVDRVAAESNRRLAEVRAAVELDEDQRRRLAEALGRAIGRTVEVRATVDPYVLGGFVATIGDVVVDGSTRHRIDALRERLTLPEATITTTGDASRWQS